MGSTFDVVGTIERASSGKSLKIDLRDLPFTTFRHVFYVGLEAMEELLAGHKKTATIYMLKPQQRISPAAKNLDL
jgi:hypothetical protein